MSIRAFCCLLLLLVVAPTRADEKKRGLAVIWIDTEGGAATLIVTPAGESVLIDCGNPGSRDAERIDRAVRKAGLKAIDHLIITHWHLDHYGSVGRLSKLLPIHHFWDRGIPAKLDEDRANFPVLISAYRKAAGGKSTTLAAGDAIKLKQAAGSPAVKLLCVCASGKVLPDREGAPANPIAREHKPQPIDNSDNARSLGFVLSFGDWRFLDLGDLTWNVEYKLIAPTNKIGWVDVYQVTHHGLEISNNPVLIRSVNPRVAICNNGPRKGGHPTVISTLRRLPDVKGIYQMHRNLKGTDSENVDDDHIANDGRKKQSGENIVLRVAADARSYTVTVGTRGKTRSYPTRGTAK